MNKTNKKFNKKLEYFIIKWNIPKKIGSFHIILDASILPIFCETNISLNYKFQKIIVKIFNYKIISS